MSKRFLTLLEIAKELEDIVVCNCESHHGKELTTGHTYLCNISRQALELQELCFENRTRRNHDE